MLSLTSSTSCISLIARGSGSSWVSEENQNIFCQRQGDTDCTKDGRCLDVVQ